MGTRSANMEQLCRIRTLSIFPDETKAPGKDVERVLSRTRLGVDPSRYERYLQVWRYNSFGHHVESEGLVLYNSKYLVPGLQ